MTPRWRVRRRRGSHTLSLDGFDDVKRSCDSHLDPHCERVRPFGAQPMDRDRAVVRRADRARAVDLLLLRPATRGPTTRVWWISGPPGRRRRSNGRARAGRDVRARNSTPRNLNAVGRRRQPARALAASIVTPRREIRVTLPRRPLASFRLRTTLFLVVVSCGLVRHQDSRSCGGGADDAPRACSRTIAEE